MSKKLKYHLDHPQIKRNKSWGNDSVPGDKPGQSAGGFLSKLGSMVGLGGSKTSTQNKSATSQGGKGSGTGNMKTNLGFLASGTKPPKK